MVNATGTNVSGDDYTSYPEYKAAIVIWKVVPPILILFGTIGNILSIIVLTRKSIRSSTISLYLTVLACSDLLVLYTGLLRQWIRFKFDMDVRRLSSVGCKIHIWLVYSSLDFSAWILMAVTLERVISAWWPHKARTNCTRKPAMALLSGVGVFLLALNSHLLYGMAVREKSDDAGNSVLFGKCREVDESYDSFFNHAWPWIDLCAFCVLPLTGIVIGNACIIFKVLKSERKTHSAVVPSIRRGSSSVRHHCGSAGKNSSMTAMLFTLNTVFLITTTPVSVYNIGYAHWMDGATNQALANLDLWWAITNMLMYTNNSLNFLLYCLSGTRFRHEVSKLLFPHRADLLNILQHSRSHVDQSRAPSPARPSHTVGDMDQLPAITGLHPNPSLNQTETCFSNDTNPTHDREPNHGTYSGNCLHPKAANSVYHNGLPPDMVTKITTKRSGNIQLREIENHIIPEEIVSDTDSMNQTKEQHTLDNYIINNSENHINIAKETTGSTLKYLSIADGNIGPDIDDCINHTLEIARPDANVDDVTRELPIIPEAGVLNDTGSNHGIKTALFVLSADMSADHNAPILDRKGKLQSVNATESNHGDCTGVPQKFSHSVNAFDVNLQSISSELESDV